VYSSLDGAYRDIISDSYAEKSLTTVASISQGLHWRLLPLLNNHHTSSLTYRPCSKRLDQGKKRCNTRLTIIDNERTLQQCGNASTSRRKVAIQTRPHLEKHCIISWWLMHSPPCGPSATNHMNCITPLVLQVYFQDHTGSLDNPTMNTWSEITNYHSDFPIQSTFRISHLLVLSPLPDLSINWSTTTVKLSAKKMCIISGSVLVTTSLFSMVSPDQQEHQQKVKLVSENGPHTPILLHILHQ